MQNEIYAIVLELLEKLPKCQCRTDSGERCTERAEYCCADAAGDPIKTCKAHRIFNGGWNEDDEPYLLSYAEPAGRLSVEVSKFRTKEIEEKIIETIRRSNGLLLITELQEALKEYPVKDVQKSIITLISQGTITAGDKWKMHI